MPRLTAAGFVTMFIVAACAMGGSPSGPSDAPPGGGHKDAHYVTGDARPPADAHEYHDAAGMSPDAAMPDAGGGGGLCQVNTDCPDLAQCCFIALCVNGTRVGNNVCLPM